MKLSEIFKRVLPREEPSPEPQMKERNPVILPPFADPPQELSGEENEAEPPPFEPPRVPLPAGYFYPDSREAAQLHAELLRELPPDHPLFGVPLETFAARDGNDDALFCYRGNLKRFVLLHLTWLGRTEINAEHPAILFAGTFEEFLQREKELYGLEPLT